MRIAVSVDMEGASQLQGVREIFGCFPEYWATGRPRLEADVVAACEGLLAGGATEIVLFDNHGGNTVNFGPELLPAGARVETWHAYDLPGHGFDAMFQVGYHARGGAEGFLSHTYLPGLRLRVGDELISEAHGRIWASELPLLGITGNDVLEQTLGSLTGTPYLVVQHSEGRGAMTPLYGEQEGLDAIRSFAEACVRDAVSRQAVTVPAEATLEASMPNGADVVDVMIEAGWKRVGEVEYALAFQRWSATREPIGVAMAAGMTPFVPYWLGGFPDARAAATADPASVALLGTIFDAWATESQPEWYTAPADPFPPGVRERLPR